MTTPAAPAKGTATPIASLIAPDDARAATLRVAAAIADHRRSLDRLHSFIADNSALAARVRRLPDDLSHDIMVPFGSAAFFPGRLVHTNEFLVLLGEGYYAERTAKQTVEILERRGEALAAQVESIKGLVMDLEAEARFFETTAAEAEEGLVEIREEYIDEPQNSGSETGVPQSSPPGSSETDNPKLSIEDTEYARIMARLDELEKEEVEEEEEEEEEKVAKEVEVAAAPASNLDKDAEFFSKGKFANQSSDLDINLQLAAKGSRQSCIEQSDTEQNAASLREPKGNLHTVSELDREDFSDSVPTDTFTRGFDGRKAFTGAVIERSHGLPPIKSSKTSILDKPSESNTAKPVSRFKLQRGNR